MSSNKQVYLVANSHMVGGVEPKLHELEDVRCGDGCHLWVEGKLLIPLKISRCMNISKSGFELPGEHRRCW
jgi:hypothetical protein